MKLSGTKSCFAVLAIFLGCFFIADAAAEGIDDPELLLGEWSIRPMFAMSISGDKISIRHESLDPGDTASIIFHPQGTGIMRFNDESVPFKWVLEYGETLKITYDGYESYSELQLINDGLLLMAEDQGSYSAVAVLERIYLK